MLKKISDNKLLIGGTVLGLGCAALLYLKLTSKPRLSTNFKKIYPLLVAELKEQFQKAGPPTGVMSLELYLQIATLTEIASIDEIRSHSSKFVEERLPLLENDMEKYESMIIDEQLRDQDILSKVMVKIVQDLELNMDWFVYSAQSYENLDVDSLLEVANKHLKEGYDKITSYGATNPPLEVCQKFFDKAVSVLPEFVEKYPQSNPELVEQFYRTMMYDIGRRDFGLDFENMDHKLWYEPFLKEQSERLEVMLRKLAKEAKQKAEGAPRQE